MSARCYTDAEWAQVIAAEWQREVPRLAVPRKVIYSYGFDRTYGSVMAAPTRPTRGDIRWMLMKYER